jgi:hypothetical protein
MATVLYEPAFAVVATWFERDRAKAMLLLTVAGARERRVRASRGLAHYGSISGGHAMFVTSSRALAPVAVSGSRYEAGQVHGKLDERRGIGV